MTARILISSPSTHLPGLGTVPTDREARGPPPRQGVGFAALGSWFLRGGAGGLTGWGFSTTQQPSLCQNSLMFPAGSSFTPPPEAPEGSRSAALTAPPPRRCNNTWVHSWTALEKESWEPRAGQ